MLMDPRYDELAKTLIDYSIGLKKGEKILFDLVDAPEALAVALIRAARSRKGIPFVELKDSRVNRELLLNMEDSQARLLRDIEMNRMRKMQAYIAIRGSYNASESADVPGPKLSLFTRTMRPVLNYRVNKTRWCVLRWPNPSMAQAANMSTEAFEDFYFRVCSMNYRKMARAMKPLQRLMARTDRVHIKSPNTDLTFSVKGMGAQECKGDRNIPDGEVFSCPVKDSVNGVIQYNTATTYAGTRFENVRLEFENGRVVKATSSNTRRLNEILDTDAGARYIGEFSLGFNPYIVNPMGDILFDEKIAGSLHFTPGQAYESCDNGNRSAVHWDMVLIQRKEWGGGEVWFDGNLIRKNGLFIPKNLVPLNPSNLKG